MQEYAEKEELLSQPRRMLISRFELTKGNIITPSQTFYLEFGIVFTKNYCFVEYTPVKCFYNFVQSAVTARCHGNENADYNVVAETMNMLSNSP